MTLLINVVWRARLAGLLWRWDYADTVADAWAIADRSLWRHYRAAGFSPRQALARSYAAHDGEIMVQ